MAACKMCAQDSTPPNPLDIHDIILSFSLSLKIHLKFACDFDYLGFNLKLVREGFGDDPLLSLLQNRDEPLLPLVDLFADLSLQPRSLEKREQHTPTKTNRPSTRPSNRPST